jgi:hypothetical protein
MSTKEELLKELADAKQQAAHAEAEKEAFIKAKRDRQQAQEMEGTGDTIVLLPGGRRSLASELEILQHKYPAIKRIELEFLSDPRKFVKDPDPNVEYWLPDGKDRDGMTEANIAARIYTPVLDEEMDKTKRAPTHVGTDKYVHWKRHILVKVDKAYAEATKRAPEQQAVLNLIGEYDRIKEQAYEKTRGKGSFTVTRDNEPI